MPGPSKDCPSWHPLFSQNLPQEPSHQEIYPPISRFPPPPPSRYHSPVFQRKNMTMNLRLPAVFLAASAFAAALCAAAPAPRIVCPAPDYDFGSLDNSATVEHDYPIRNEGSLTLEITSVRASCGCTVATASNRLVPPGGETSVHATFALKGRIGFQQKSITVESNDPDTPALVLQLRGTAVQSLRATPSSVFFGRLAPDADRSRQIEIFSADGPFAIVSVDSTSPHVTAAVQPADSSTAVRPVLVTVAPDAPEGNLSATLTLRTDIPGAPDLTVPVNAFIAP